MTRQPIPPKRDYSNPTSSTPFGLILSQRDVAKVLGVSRARVHQLEMRALGKIRKAIAIEAAAAGVSVRDWAFGEA